MDALWTDLRFALRHLLGHPGFAAAAIVSLALGIGANTAMFTLANAMFGKTHHLYDADALVKIQTTDPDTQVPFGISVENARDLAAQLEPLAGHSLSVMKPVRIRHGEVDHRGMATFTSLGYFSLLGVEPMLGRVYNDAPSRAASDHNIAVLGHRYWQKHFHGDPAVVGQTVHVGGHPLRIIGVAPHGFHGVEHGLQPAAFVPWPLHETILPGAPEFRGRRMPDAFLTVRLKSSSHFEQAAVQLETLAAHLVKEYPEANRERDFIMTRFADSLQNTQQMGNSAVLLIISGLILIIACANVVNLLLARTTHRRPEFAMRQAVGATPVDLIRQLMLENLVLAHVGALLGLLIALWLRDGMWSIFLSVAPVLDQFDPSMDAESLGFTAVVALFSTLLFGWTPLWFVLRSHPREGLAQGSATVTASVSLFNLRNFLIIAQVSVCMLATSSAGLAVRGLLLSETMDRGYEPQGLWFVDLDLSEIQGDRKQRTLLRRRIQNKVTHWPEVEIASVCIAEPMRAGVKGLSVFADTKTSTARDGFTMAANGISPSYFQTLGVHVRGRSFTERDDDSNARVVIVNRAFEDRYWPGGSALGQSLRYLAFEEPAEIVGVVDDFTYGDYKHRPRPKTYLPLAQWPQVMGRVDDPVLMLRARGDVSFKNHELGKRVQAIEPAIGVHFVGPFSAEVANARILTWLLTGMATISGLLAAIGIYSLMTYVVGQRTREIGIRMAMGAPPAAVLLAVVGRAGIFVGLGLGVGLAASLAVAPPLSEIVGAPSPIDPPALIAGIVAMIAVALAASYVPCRRATSINPAVALRADGEAR